jgi:hypothetical protein
MDFLTFYPKGKNMFIELIPDKLIAWQPKTENEIDEKIRDVSPLIDKMKDYCDKHSVTLIMIIDCDKAIYFDKLNYVLACKLVSRLTQKHPDNNNLLRRIEIRHCNSAVSGIYNASKPLLPKRITDIFHIYNN